MRRFFNFILILLIILFIGLLLVPNKDVDRKAGVYVEHEWDKLENVIVGSPKMFSVPGYHKTMEFKQEYSAKNSENIKKVAGKPMAEIDPYFYGQLVEQSDNIAKILQDAGVTVQRLNPEVLSVEELRLMKDIQPGQNYLYPRDSVIVIGNHVIETSMRIPMRVKDKYIARKVFRPLLHENHDLHYVAMPEVSPSFPDTGMYLEGGDVLLDGYNIYVGFSGFASNMRGIKWLKRYLGPKYKVHAIEIKGAHHLDDVMALVRPGLGIIDRNAIVGDLPKTLKRWDFINVTPEETKNLGASILIIGPNKVLVDERCESLISQLRSRNVDVTSVPIAAVASAGGGLGSSYAPIRRAYDDEINKKKISIDSIKASIADTFDYIKSLNYGLLFSKITGKITNKFSSLFGR